VDGGKRLQELRLTHRVPRLEFDKGPLEQLPEKRHRPSRHALLERFGRHCHWRRQLCPLRRQLC
jgi:hypothetical protein